MKFTNGLKEKDWTPIVSFRAQEKLRMLSNHNDKTTFSVFIINRNVVNSYPVISSSFGIFNLKQFDGIENALLYL